MLERFTTQARGVVIEARHEARHLNHHFVGTEHVLLALLRPESGPAHALLTEAGLRESEARAGIARLLEQSAQDPLNGALGEEDAAALEAIGIDLDAIRTKLEESFGPGALDPVPPPRPQGLFRRKAKPASPGVRYTKRAKVVLELALREAVALRHDRIGTEHLLLGLLRENGLAVRVIRDAGIDPADLRRRTMATFEKAA